MTFAQRSERESHQKISECLKEDVPPVSLHRANTRTVAASGGVPVHASRCQQARTDGCDSSTSRDVELWLQNGAYGLTRRARDARQVRQSEARNGPVAYASVRAAHPVPSDTLYFASRTSNAHRVPSSTSVMYWLMAGFSSAPVL